MWLFFRDDDLGWEPAKFARLLTTFARHDQKLNAAAIPDCLTDEMLAESIPYSYQAAPYLQVVTHGFAHRNHAAEGQKKCEFGVSRERASVREELLAGRERLQGRLENYFPCFVPPWNRFHESFLDLLPECGYAMLSRETEVAAKSGRAAIPEFDVALDLHTRKDGLRLDGQEIFRALANRQEEGHAVTGVMLHHCKMEEADFEALDLLLKQMSKRSIESMFFSEMLPEGARRRGIEVSHV